MSRPRRPGSVRPSFFEPEPRFENPNNPPVETPGNATTPNEPIGTPVSHTPQQGGNRKKYSKKMYKRKSYKRKSRRSRSRKYRK